MNIVLINSIGKNKWGGGEKWMIMAASGLLSLGHDIVVVCRKNSILSQRALAKNIPVREIGANSDFDILAWLQFAYFFNKFKPDVVIGCQNKDWRVASMAAKAIGSSAQVFSRQGLQLLKNHWWYKWSVKLFCDGIITNTYTIKKEYESFLPVEKDFIKVIFNGVEEEDKQTKGFDYSGFIPDAVRDPVVILSTGRLAHQKGFKFLVKAAAEIIRNHPNVFFFLAGKGRLENDIKRLIVKKNLQNNFFLIGFHDDIPQLLSTADVFVIPSLYEGMPNSVLEAMIYNLPVVASKVNGVSELIEDGVNGYTVAAGDVQQLINKLTILVEDKDKRKKIGMKGHEFVSENFTVQKMVNEFDSFLRSRIEKKVKQDDSNLAACLDNRNLKMRIAFDAKRVFHNFTGLGNYSRDLIRVLSHFYPDNLYLLYNPKKQKKTVFKYNSSCVCEIRPHNLFFHFLPSVWRQFKILKDLRKDNITLFHGLSGEIPSGLRKSGIKSIVTVHDLIFMRYPQFYSFIDRKIHTIKARYATRNADVVVAVSEQTKRDVVDFFGVSPDKIQVIYQGCQDIYKTRFPSDEIDHVRKKYGLPERYILNVGTVEHRKNILVGVKAIEHINEHLVVVGSETDYAVKVKDYITEHKMQSRVSFLKGVSNADLAMLYQGASLFIYPSLFEGFGIPIVEALNSDTPVITSKDGCFSEAGGTGSIYVDPHNPAELQAAITRVFSDETLKKNMVEQGRKHALKFSDENIADQYIKLYQTLV